MKLQYRLGHGTETSVISRNTKVNTVTTIPRIDEKESREKFNKL